MPKTVIKIGQRCVGEKCPVFIIAEAGVNHNGSLKLAKKLIDEAKSAGADAVKFQTFIAEQVMTQATPKALYQIKATDRKESQLEMAKSFQLSFDEFAALIDYAKKKDIILISTPFDGTSAQFLINMRLPAIKIASGEITNFQLLDLLNKSQRPLILSTGMSTVGEIKSALKHLEACPVILLHCTSNYPTNYKDVNLNSLKTMNSGFDNLIGYSDHTTGNEVAIAAVAMGACVIEKHFTLDKNLPGPDHKSSLVPEELKSLVQSIRRLEAAMGDGIKRPMKSELAVKKIVRKSIVAERDIPKGTILVEEMVAIKRPGTGIEPKYLESLIGVRTKEGIKKDHVLKWEHIS